MTEHDELTAVWPVPLEAIEPPPERGNELFQEARERGERDRSQPTFIGGRDDVQTSDGGHLPLGQSRVVALADLADAEHMLALAKANDAEAEGEVKRALAQRKVTQAHEALCIERLRKAQATVKYTCGLTP